MILEGLFNPFKKLHTLIAKRLKNKVYYFAQTRARLEHREIDFSG